LPGLTGKKLSVSLLKELPGVEEVSGNTPRNYSILRVFYGTYGHDLDGIDLAQSEGMTKIAAGMQRIRESEFWKSSTFWLTVAAIVLPFGWLLFALKLEPVRVRARYFRRSF